MRADLFKNPGAESRIKPFWFWNGEMDEAEMACQIGEMADKGIGGFFICPRQGLKLPYLSDAWFDKVRFAVRTAEKYGLEVWLYDEYPYPSGMAGGEVILRHPEARHTTLEHVTAYSEGPGPVQLELPWAAVLLAEAVPEDRAAGKYLYDRATDLSGCIGNYQAEEVFQKAGLTSYNSKRYFTYGPRKRLLWNAPEGRWKIIVFMEREIEDFKYFGSYVDPCCKEAVGTFIRTTHERYREELGEYFGGVIKGIFSDEVAPLGKIPWSSRLPEFFRERNGYDIIRRLPALIDSGYGDASKTRYELYNTMHLLFREAYHKQIGRWCAENGIMLATEVPSARMTTQVNSGIPGGDSAHEKLGRPLEWVIDLNCADMRGNPKQISSLARQLGKKYAMIECFHSVGWSMTLQDAKWMIDRMAAFGINYFVFHAFFYTLDSLKKHDAPPSQFLQNPYWKYFRLLGDYAGRISYVMSEGKALTDIAVLDPTTTLWTFLANPFHGFRYAGFSVSEHKKLEMLKEDWAYLCKTLLVNQVDYDHIDAELLAEAAIEDGRLALGNASYSILLLPPITNIEDRAWEKIKAFSRAGGVVIGLGLLPFDDIEGNTGIKEEVRELFGAGSSAVEAYWGNGEKNAAHTGNGGAQWIKGRGRAYFLGCCGGLAKSCCGGSLLKLIAEAAPRIFMLEAAGGGNKSFLMSSRAMPDGSYIVFIANQEEGEADLLLTAGLRDTALRFEKMELETGEYIPLQAPAEFTREGWRLPMHFAPYTSCLVRITAAAEGEAEIPRTAERPRTFRVDAGKGWRVSAEQPNVVRFGSFHFMTDSAGKGERESWHLGETGSDWPMVEAKTLIDQCADCGGREYRVSFGQSFGTPVKLSLSYPVKCWYQSLFYVESIPEQAGLLMDKGGISGGFTIYINGTPLALNDFKREFRYDYQNQACDIRRLLRQGVNSMVVSVEAGKDWDGLLDPIYITGPFGVTFRGDGIPVLGLPTEASGIRGGIISGYPYYSGTLSFRKQVTIASAPGEKSFELIFDNWDAHFHECAEVLVNGRSLGVRAWTPYAWRGSGGLLRPGVNEVEVRVTNTLVNMLDGKYFDYEAHKLREAAEKPGGTL